MPRLGGNRYGKAEVRVLRVGRGEGPDGSDALRDWNVSTSLSGDLTAVHLSGDNAHVLPTDTQKNTVYAFAQRLGGIEPEAFALALGEHFVGSQAPITRARVAVEQYGWRPGAAGHAFVRDGGEVRTTTVVHDEDLGATVVSGIEDLVLLNTTNSEFWGFATDGYTTLPETRDRILATQVSARWRFRATAVDWAAAHDAARDALLTAFADTYSYSLQQTLYAMGTRILGTVGEICEVRLALPNKHHFLVDLSSVGLTNDNAVYLAADRPYGLIEGTVLADDADEAPHAWS
jgi:urate oxidase